jgi:CMP-2-keto-3-deoxyoctulosonic acid synthetase
VFEIGVFGYSQEAIKRYFDYERCPFKQNAQVHQGFFDLELEELVAIRPPPEILQRINY